MVKHWTDHPSMTGEFPSLKTSKAWQDKAMSNLMQCGSQPCLEQEVGLLGYITLDSADCYLVVAGGLSQRALLLEILV